MRAALSIRSAVSGGRAVSRGCGDRHASPPARPHQRRKPRADQRYYHRRSAIGKVTKLLTPAERKGLVLLSAVSVLWASCGWRAPAPPRGAAIPAVLVQTRRKLGQVHKG